jgi:uncharacterized protein (DUF1778 family)
VATRAKESTLDLRVTPEQKEIIRRVAASRDQTITEVILAAVEPVARKVVERQGTIELTERA